MSSRILRQDKRAWRSDAGEEHVYVRFRRQGFCVLASTALMTIASGKVHAITCEDYNCGECGANTQRVRSADGVQRVKGWVRITCLRCTTLLLLRAHRAGELSP